MKKTFFLAGIASLLLSLSINAQQDSTKPMAQDTTQQSVQQPAQSMQQPAQTQAQTQTQSTTAVEQKKYGNPTVDSILSKYTLVPMPNPITTEQIFPVIGQYQSTTNADQKITVTLDDQNKGYAWVDGLPQGKVKAILKKSPSTYKIPAQKDAEGKDIPEGTLIFDKDANTLSINIGKPYNMEDPSSVFLMPTTTDETAVAEETTTKTKTKTASGKTIKSKTKEPVIKPWVYTGTKVEKTTVMSTPSTTNQ